MLSKIDIANIQRLKGENLSQRKIAKQLGFSRSTVARHWGESDKLDLDDLFVMHPCRICTTKFPMPKFLKTFHCPNCGEKFVWKQNWFKPDKSDPGKNQG